MELIMGILTSLITCFFFVILFAYAACEGAEGFKKPRNLEVERMKAAGVKGDLYANK